MYGFFYFITMYCKNILLVIGFVVMIYAVVIFSTTIPNGDMGGDTTPQLEVNVPGKNVHLVLDLGNLTVKGD